MTELLPTSARTTTIRCLSRWANTSKNTLTCTPADSITHSTCLPSSCAPMHALALPLIRTNGLRKFRKIWTLELRWYDQEHEGVCRPPLRPLDRSQIRLLRPRD